MKPIPTLSAQGINLLGRKQAPRVTTIIVRKKFQWTPYSDTIDYIYIYIYIYMYIT